MTQWPRACALTLILAVSACATRTAPPLPPALAYPDFLYPAAPGASQAQAATVDRGWRYLQNGRLEEAEQEFSVAFSRAPSLSAAATGLGYVALARRDYSTAVARFDRALEPAAGYAPALVGRGQALLLLDRDAEALQALEAALRADASLQSLQPRIDVLRFRTLQNLITSAREARDQGRYGDARAAYERAVAAAPDSAALFKELGALERLDGNAAAALRQWRRAAELDPGDASAFVQIGELLEGQRDFPGAEEAYRRAAALDPTGGADRRADGVARLAREATLPEPFRALLEAPAITRGDLAALIGVRLESTLARAGRTPAVTTDTLGHWAAAWIADVVATSVMPPFDNHTFQPESGLRRVDLAEAMYALLGLVAQSHPEVRSQMTARPTVSDVSPTHLNYPAVAAVVSTGVLPLGAGDRFDTEAAVSGQEAAAAVDRVRALDQAR